MLKSKEETFMADLGVNPQEEIEGMHGTKIKVSQLLKKFINNQQGVDQKTPMEKAREDIKKYVRSLDTPTNKIYHDNELLILSCFSKAQEILEANELPPNTKPEIIKN